MPTLSMFYGIIITMYRESNSKHNLPHIHAYYQDYNASLSFDGTVLEGSIPSGKLKLVIAWIEIHKDELEANWKLLSEGKKFYKIKPLV